jgi:hypothetical protein
MELHRPLARWWLGPYVVLDAKVVAESEATEVRGPPPIQNRLAGDGGSSSGRLRVILLPLWSYLAFRAR